MYSPISPLSIITLEARNETAATKEGKPYGIAVRRGFLELKPRLDEAGVGRRTCVRERPFA
jgi:hypothetical protein